MKLFAALTATLLPFTASAASDAPKRLQAAADAFKEYGNPDKSDPAGAPRKGGMHRDHSRSEEGRFHRRRQIRQGFRFLPQEGRRRLVGPGSVRIEGGSVGFQIGGSEMDVFMLVMNDRGMERLLGDKFTLGADATVAAGPVGRVAQAETDARMTAEILAWSRAHGLFAGIALNGATMREDDDWNQDLYGKPLKNREIVSGSVLQPQVAAVPDSDLPEPTVDTSY
jgi:hypothetical protein